jgi:hypothetical protein
MPPPLPAVSSICRRLVFVAVLGSRLVFFVAQATRHGLVAFPAFVVSCICFRDEFQFFFGSTSDDPCTPLEGSLLRWGEFYAKLDKLELYEG